MSSAASRPPQALSQSMSQQPMSQQSISQQSMSQQFTSASGSTGSTGNTSGSNLRKPPSRPQLIGPPARPKPPLPQPVTAPVESSAVVLEPAPETPQKIGPISPPSERMQYRAIGLLKGKYVASEEQFNRGNIVAEDGTLIDAVLLGRVTSLIKKHIDLESEHIWVVYPRTLYSEENIPALHVQIVGVWEPETLNARSTTEEADQLEPTSQYLSTAEAAEQCNAFSVRGEIAKYSEEKHEIVVNIVQKSKSEAVKPKRPFKLLISGQLDGRSTGYFWDLQVTRQEGTLILKEATQIAVVPPKKKPKDARKAGSSSNRRRPPAGKPRSNSSVVPKPVPKKGAAEIGAAEKEAVEALTVEVPTAEAPKVEASLSKSVPVTKRSTESPTSEA